jgi:hypothetical protein
LSATISPAFMANRYTRLAAMYFADSLTPTNYMHRLCHRPLTVQSHKTARGTHLALALFAHSSPYLPVAAWLGATGDHRPGPEKGWVQLDVFSMRHPSD